MSAAKQQYNRDSVSNISRKTLMLLQKNEPILDYPLPRQTKPAPPDQKGAFNPNYMSTTHTSFKPTFTGEKIELYKPTWVKMDKQVISILFL